MVNDVSDAQWIAFNATAGPYVAVVSTSMFYDVIELLINHSDKVAGVLLYENETLRWDLAFVTLELFVYRI